MSPAFEYLFSRVWHCLERFRENGLDVNRAGFESLRLHPTCSSLLACSSGCELSEAEEVD